MGLFIAIEGGDGSGKGTQTKLLVEHYRAKGKDVLEVDFPQYEQDSALYVTRYLNGEYGAADDVPADLASLAYALDRYSVKDKIVEHLSRPNSLVIANRYVASNMAHQGTKFADSARRKQFYDEIQHLEFNVFGIAKPDLNIVLLVPAKVSQNNVDNKAARNYTANKRDIHEASIDHLERAKSNFEELCSHNPETFTPVWCSELGDSMRSIEDINSEIINRIQRVQR